MVIAYNMNDNNGPESIIDVLPQVALEYFLGRDTPLFGERSEVQEFSHLEDYIAHGKTIPKDELETMVRQTSTKGNVNSLDPFIQTPKSYTHELKTLAAAYFILNKENSSPPSFFLNSSLIASRIYKEKKGALGIQILGMIRPQLAKKRRNDLEDKFLESQEAIVEVNTELNNCLAAEYRRKR
ncbi:hypothetical protein HOD05_01165 [Candidatus Woesearchaeota archaeon]|jgi:hypothetical protein|nr:hypothetical protein [Candidatus Woesearchaeota archaeon]MBT4151017.1 hypothetical protein [Candidatus Woesearchaeota archaeon]MBT4247214.1 hypothetical protein [Candidatus Woesearchaeota archaeon]MBT4433807.1 hypothetical protein [Candidatus Woesearchaeota archaeon]MBT7332194.1 hypothetical protein [Candidatus Woesearchaeota archaeon]